MTFLTPELTAKLKKIKMVITDVDGVLTDSYIYYNKDGYHQKRFNVKDGMGAAILRHNGIYTGLISTSDSEIPKIRAERIKMDFAVIGESDKRKIAQIEAEKRGLTLENVAFIGDDINDIDLLQHCGFSACPANAVDDVQFVVNYKCKRNGGEGVFREITELVRAAQNLELPLKFTASEIPLGR